MSDPNLRRVELAYLGFNMTEFATWIAILVYAFERGGAAEAGMVAVILLIPSAIVAPFAAYAGDRFRRDRVLLIDYLVQGVAIGATALTLFVDAAPWRLHRRDHRLDQHHLHPARSELARPRAHGDPGRPHRDERRDGRRRGLGEDARAAGRRRSPRAIGT